MRAAARPGPAAPGRRSVVFVVYGRRRPGVRAPWCAGCGAPSGGPGSTWSRCCAPTTGGGSRPAGPGAPPSGVPYDVGGHRFRAQAVVEGIVVHGSRAELEALLRPVPEAVAEIARGGAPGGAEPAGRDRRPGRPPPRRRAVHRPPSWPGCCSGLRERRRPRRRLGRDDPRVAPRHVRLWTDAVQRAPDELVAAPAAVLGLAAWLAGHGALAWCAVDRCCEPSTPTTRWPGWSATCSPTRCRRRPGPRAAAG